jgi:hypothetical protein
MQKSLFPLSSVNGLALIIHNQSLRLFTHHLTISAPDTEYRAGEVSRWIALSCSTALP